MCKVFYTVNAHFGVAGAISMTCHLASLGFSCRYLPIKKTLATVIPNDLLESFLR